jgi:nucleotide-binding universal stress UspA family protein
MFERILVPLDGSRFSGRALPYTIEIAKCFGAEVLLLKVVRQTPLVAPTGGSVMASPAATQMLIESAKAQDRRNIGKANRYLRAKSRELAAHGVGGSYHAVLGEPAKAIITFCQKQAVDLVVMTTSGKSGLRRAFLGSVADRVIREPGTPVLAIRPQRRREKDKQPKQ